MSGAESAANTLQETLRRQWQATQDAGKAYAQAFIAAAHKKDVLAVMQATVAVISTVEQLKAAAEEAAHQLRATLAQQMMDTGATTLQSEGLNAYLSRKPAFVSVDQPDMLPAEYLKQAEPTVDRKKIKTAIEAGEDVPGCSLVRPNEMQLSIRGAKQA